MPSSAYHLDVAVVGSEAAATMTVQAAFLGEAAGAMRSVAAAHAPSAKAQTLKAYADAIAHALPYWGAPVPGVSASPVPGVSVSVGPGPSRFDRLELTISGSTADLVDFASSVFDLAVSLRSTHPEAVLSDFGSALRAAVQAHREHVVRTAP